MINRKLKILWADDQPKIQATLAELLNELAVEIVHSRDGETALEELRKRDFDLLITDLKMPPETWGGLWLLRAIKANGLEIPSIVLSGEGTQNETIKALREGASDYVMKDNSKQELRDRVIEVIEREGPAVLLREMIRNGENPNFECKETLRWDVRQGRIEKYIEQQSAKTIAAFLNTRGGTLAIGVKDSGEVVGLDQDNFKDRDACLLHLDNVIKNFLGDKISALLTTSFVEIDSKEVLKVDCEQAGFPTYLKSVKNGETEFYIRRQASSVKLPVDETVSYIQEHFAT